MPETTPYAGPERRGALSVNLDIKSLLFVIGFIAAILPVITLVMQIRQDVRGNSIRMTAAESRLQTLEEAKRRGDDMVLRYCVARMQAADSTRVTLPDIGC